MNPRTPAIDGPTLARDGLKPGDPQRIPPFSARAACALVVALITSAQALPDDWPQWRGPARDAVWNETGVLESFTPDGLSVAWRVPVSRGWSSPVIARNRVYLTDVIILESGPPRSIERVLCFDEATGKRLWTHEYSAGYPAWAFDPNAGGPRATPVVRDGKIYTLGAMGHLFCLNATNGKAAWEKNLAKEYQLREFTGITASPLIEDDLLILYMCGKPSACVAAFDKETGREAWRALDDTFTYSSPIIISAGGKRQLIVWTQEAVTSLDPKTGRVWWREELRTSGDSAVSTPVFSDPYLLVSGLMFKLDPARPAASVLWPEKGPASRRVLSNTSTPLMIDGLVFSAKTSGELVCLEAKSGAQLWVTNAVTSQGNGSSIHLARNGHSVFLFTDQGNLIRARLNAQGYFELGRAHLIDPAYPFGGRNVVWPPPAFANRHVFARSDKELVRASIAAPP